MGKGHSLTSHAFHDSQSYFQTNAEKLKNSTLASADQAFKSLLISFLTIKQYRDLLFEPRVNLRVDISSDFLNQVMIPDFNTVILNLRDYAGNERRGIREAYKSMDSALRELYQAHNEKGLVDAAMDCRNHLHAAYQQLEYLNHHLTNLTSV